MAVLRLKLALLALALALAGCTKQPGERVKAIVGATLMDGTGRPPTLNAVVVVEDALIVDLGEAAAVDIPPEAAVVQAQGKFIFPADLNQPLGRGGPADLLIVSVNPATDPEYTSKTRGRMRAGHWAEPPY